MCLYLMTKTVHPIHTRTVSYIQDVPKLVSPHTLVDCFSNPNCQAVLTHIGDFSEESLSRDVVLYFTKSGQVSAMLYPLVS